MVSRVEPAGPGGEGGPGGQLYRFTSQTSGLVSLLDDLLYYGPDFSFPRIFGGMFLFDIVIVSGRRACLQGRKSQ